MKKSILAIIGMILVLAISYLVYDLVKGYISPCETIFKQTSIQLGSKLKLLRTQGELVIGEKKIQELTNAAQLTALNLKTCCIVLNAGGVDLGQFLQCKDSAKVYEGKMDAVLDRIEAAKSAKTMGKLAVYKEEVRAVNISIDEVKRVSEEIKKQVDILDDAKIRPTTNADKSSRGIGKLTTIKGSFIFDRIGGMWRSSGNKLTVLEFGATIQIPLSTVSSLKFTGSNTVQIEYRDGRSETSDFSCYWNIPVTLYSGDKEIYYGGCKEFMVVKEIEFYHDA